ARDELEKKVQERTTELSSSNEQLRQQITERKEAEQELRRSEAFLTQGQRISHTGSWTWNVPTGKVAWSEEHFRIFGFDHEKTEPSFQLFLETVHPEDRSFIERSLDGAVRERRGFDIEFRWRARVFPKDGGRRWRSGQSDRVPVLAGRQRIVDCRSSSPTLRAIRFGKCASIVLPHSVMGCELPGRIQSSLRKERSSDRSAFTAANCKVQ